MINPETSHKKQQQESKTIMQDKQDNIDVDSYNTLDEVF